MSHGATHSSIPSRADSTVTQKLPNNIFIILLFNTVVLLVPSPLLLASHVPLHCEYFSVQNAFGAVTECVRLVSSRSGTVSLLQLSNSSKATGMTTCQVYRTSYYATRLLCYTKVTGMTNRVKIYRTSILAPLLSVHATLLFVHWPPAHRMLSCPCGAR